jgi:hypothetical protein
MVWHVKTLCAAAAVVALAMILPSAAEAQDACSSPAKQRDCSVECCGRATCAPSCQGDCVRACVDACRTPQQRSVYQQQLQGLQQRCGYRGGPAQMQR